nr:DUF4871 domain-containing protein [Paenibacillus roseus]
MILLTIFISSCGTNTQEPNLTKWEVSPLFVSGPYTMIGKEGRLGFIYSDNELSRFYPGKQQKYMWHFWGSDPQKSQAKLGKEVKVIAVSKTTGKEMELMKTKVMQSGSYYVQSEIWDNEPAFRVPSMMSLPSPGLWRLDVYIDDKLFDSVVVRVHKKA